MKRRSTYSISTCVCPNCNNKMYVPRSNGMTKNKGHQKHMWCPFCKETKPMREIRERDFVESWGQEKRR